VPAYFYPGGKGMPYWEQLIASAPRAEIIAIVNPASGPGKRVDPAYLENIHRAHQAGLRLLGYVNTGYARPEERPPADVQADVDRWYQFYPEIDGIFFDQQKSEATGIPFYEELARHVRFKQRGALLFGNPGTACDRAYLNVLDRLCISEGTGDLPVALPEWAQPGDAPRLGVMRHSVNDSTAMRRIVREAAQSRIGYLGITDGVKPNPWDHLPAWWDEELKAVAEVNQAGGR
jgi:hypothetical protein